MRCLFALLCLIAIAAPTRAEEPLKANDRKPEAASKSERSWTVFPKLTLRPTPSLGERAPLNLSPSHIFAHKTPLLSGPEKRPGLSLGDSWKAHALQVGAMAAGFTVLSLLCGSGNCKLPSGVNKIIPKQLRVEQGPGPRPPASTKGYPSLGR